MGFVQIKIASQLPSNNYENNAFRRSFYFERETDTLWIRDKRFNNPSDLLVVVAHCLSHIANNDSFDDTDGDFIRNLYFALRTLTSDSFTLRAQPSILEPSSAEGIDEVYDTVVDMKLRVNEVTSEAESPGMTGQNQAVSGSFVKKGKTQASDK